MLTLIDVYSVPESKILLYTLLEERDPTQNISHTEMPSYIDHAIFVDSRPYDAWYLIQLGRHFVGSAYLTPMSEIGIHFFGQWCGMGLAKHVIRLLMEKNPRPRYLANINPENDRSIRFFEKLGFGHIQNTYAYEPET